MSADVPLSCRKMSKRTTALGHGDEHVNGRPSSPATPSHSQPQSQPQSAVKKSAKTKTVPQPPPSQQVLVICRNKHWRYISSFHGPWLQLPPEILETIANANYNTPRPRPIDPAVFFDLVKIRRLVDDATNLAVRAASGVASIGQRGLLGSSHHAAALGLGFGGRPPPQTKLSPERKHRMREQATHKLMEAYRLDEIACSVATMQSASSLEEVASLVLQRNSQDPDAKYVHFFHEKIPSRQLAECTSLTPLNDVISAKPSDPEPLRTRATVRVFKGDYEGAVDDLTEALKLYRLYRPAHSSPKLPQETQLLERQSHGTGRRQEDVILKEEDRPSSLEMQLVFQRAGVYLTIACRHVAAGLQAVPAPNNWHSNGGAEIDDATQQSQLEPLPAGKEARREMAEARKLVRQNAKRALRDYTAFLSHFEYSPDLPIEIAEDFTRKVNSAVNGGRTPRSHSYPLGPRSPVVGESEELMVSHRTYALSDLFSSSLPSGLPPYPSTEVVRASHLSPSVGPVQTTTETLTCHPLLTDALHALLLCHALIQTSAKELLRHAYMVARLARLADGYPVFQSSRCPARADWIEVLRASGNWIQLTGSWEDLCAPAPLPLFQSTGNGATPVPVSLPPLKQPKVLPAPKHDSAASSPDFPAAAVGAAGKELKDRIRQQAVLDALADDRETDESSLRVAIRARQLRAEHDYRLDNAVAALDAKLMRDELTSRTDPTAAADDSRMSIPSPDNAARAPPAPAPAVSANGISTSTSAKANNSNNPPATSSGAAPVPAPGLGPKIATAKGQVNVLDEGRDFPVPSTERANAIARWVMEAPPPSADAGSAGDGGVRRRRKKPAMKTAAGGTTGGLLAEAVGSGSGGVEKEGEAEAGEQV
ncbi:hypothetical protein N657DRAFT_673428 [Parathielavia appendiculata]|uniref:Histidine kinase group protein n=1 Tax=Parathielavia appendiculata TaxID=2587402 RepID=A0AAN6TVS6_9PEZI|nr:hypothetical protein N657DRAFT_673428 [Parathielavia appendiculata]